MFNNLARDEKDHLKRGCSFLFWKKSFMFLTIALLSIGLSGCGPDLTEPQEVTVEVVEALFAKSEDGEPTVEERYETLIANMSGKDDNKKNSMESLRETGKNGMTGVYFIAENPSEPQTESFSSQLVKIPRSSFTEAFRKKLGDKEDSLTLVVTLQIKDGDWKVADMNEQREEPKKKVDWIELKPYD